jgi:hypothetical protein
MFRRFFPVAIAMNILIWMSMEAVSIVWAADVNLGFKARISNNAMIVTGNGVPKEDARNQLEASQTAQAAAMVDALRNLGETVRAEKELMKISRQGISKDEREYLQTRRLFLHLNRMIKANCTSAGSIDGKFRYDRCTFDYGIYRLQSSTDMQHNVITADIMSLRTLEHNIRVIDFALASSACSDMVEALPAIIGKLGIRVDKRQLPDGSAEVDLIYKPSLNKTLITPYQKNNAGLTRYNSGK